MIDYWFAFFTKAVPGVYWVQNVLSTLLSVNCGQSEFAWRLCTGNALCTTFTT